MIRLLIWIARAAATLTLLSSLDATITQSSGAPYKKEYCIIGQQRCFRSAGFCSSSSANNNHRASVVDRKQKLHTRQHRRGTKHAILTFPLHQATPKESETGGGGGGSGTWNPFSLAVLKLGFTEPAWTSPLNYKKANGTYICANCRSPLFSSSGKYDSGSGWPSFWKTIENNRVLVKRDWDGRIECKCAKCDGHLGHVFADGPMEGSLDVNELTTVPETDPKLGYNDEDQSKYSRMPRFCINGIALRFVEEKSNSNDTRLCQGGMGTQPIIRVNEGQRQNTRGES